MWSTFFDFSINLSMTLSLINRALIFLALILCILSYCQACEPHTMDFDKPLRSLTASALNSRVLTCDGVVDAPQALAFRRPYSLGAFSI